MLTWETLQKRLKAKRTGSIDSDAELIWQLLTVVSVHPNYRHLVPEDVFNLIRQKTLEIG